MSDEEITSYLFVEDVEPEGDVGLVFGTWGEWGESLEIAAELYKSGRVAKLVVSSGVNPTNGVNEADLMARDLASLGVPQEVILLENQSTNTLENVVFSLDVIDREVGLETIHSIVAVAKNFHARRALMTLRRHVPKSMKIKVAAYISLKYPFTKDDWHETDAGRHRVLEEMNKIKTYLDKGDIAEL